MNISLQTENLMNLDLSNAAQVCESVKKAGFTGISVDFFQLSCGDIVYNRKNTYFDGSLEKLYEKFSVLKSALEVNNLVVTQTHAPFPSYLVGQNELNKYLTDVIIKTIYITKYLGCDKIVIHPPFPSNLDNTSPSELKDTTISFFSKLIDAAKETGVILCLENMWATKNKKIYGACLSDADDAVNYIDELNKIAGKDVFGFCLDVGHSVVVGRDPYLFIKKLGSRLKCIHMHDVDMNEDSHVFPFTLGVVPWERVTSALNEISYDGPVNFESGHMFIRFPKELRQELLSLLAATGKLFADKITANK